MLRVGLLGAGRIGSVHAQAISTHPSSQLVAISDAVADNAQKLADTHQSQAHTTEDIITDPNIDAVLVATSTDTHADLVEAAARQGKAVLCEKPIDLSLERARCCQTFVAKTNVPVMLGFNRRFDPNFQALKQALDAGEIGKPELLSLTSYDPAPPPLAYIKVSGGLFRDMMIHDFDMANFLMGQTPVSLVAVASALVDPEIGSVGDVDTAVVTMQYEDGRIAQIKNSRRAAYGYDQRIELLGSKGLLEAENVPESTLVKSTKDGVMSAKPTHFFLERYMSAYKAEWNAFVQAVTQQEPVPVGLNEGVLSLAMAEAASQSAKRGLPVELAAFL